MLDTGKALAKLGAEIISSTFLETDGLDALRARNCSIAVKCAVAQESLWFLAGQKLPDSLAKNHAQVASWTGSVRVVGLFRVLSAMRLAVTTLCGPFIGVNVSLCNIIHSSKNLDERSGRS
jgi:hypothetical protein